MEERALLSVGDKKTRVPKKITSFCKPATVANNFFLFYELNTSVGTVL
jgi:hypothetical protein